MGVFIRTYSGGKNAFVMCQESMFSLQVQFISVYQHSPPTHTCLVPSSSELNVSAEDVQEFSFILIHKDQKFVCVIVTPSVCLGSGSLSMAYVFKLPSTWLLRVRAATGAPQFTRSVSLDMPTSCSTYKTMVRWDSAAV